MLAPSRRVGRHHHNLDRSLVTSIDTDSARRALVTAIVMLAIDTDAQVTAEGVETTSELETLRRLDATTVQGYLLARPGVERSRNGVADPRLDHHRRPDRTLAWRRGHS